MALDDSSIDISIDYKTCDLLSRGRDENMQLVVIEGRQPAVMLKYLTSLGRTNSLSIFLSCSFREQAIRFIEREVDADIVVALRRDLPHRQYSDLLDVLAAVEALNLPISSEKQHSLQTQFTLNAQRDSDDRLRYAALYGDHALMDYRNKEVYKCSQVITTVYCTGL